MESITCPSCGEENPARFRLCGFCGTQLGTPVATTVTCPSCGEENPSRFRLCGICGAWLQPASSGADGAVVDEGLPGSPGTPLAASLGSLAPAAPAPAAPAPSAAAPSAAAPVAPAPVAPARVAPAREIRKVVTIIFTDLKDSTALGERVDPEAVNEVKDRYFSTVTDQIELHGGRVEKYIGDAIMAVFGLPRAREDDALRAVRAAFGMVGALERLNDDLEREYGVRIGSRTGVNTGEVVANTDPTAHQRLGTGKAATGAWRVDDTATVNEVLIGDV